MTLAGTYVSFRDKRDPGNICTDQLYDKLYFIRSFSYLIQFPKEVIL